MITTSNYFKEFAKLDFKSLPDSFKTMHDFVLKSTKNGSNWDAYQEGETVKKAIDRYLEKLNAHLNDTPKHKVPAKTEGRVKTKTAEKPAKVIKTEQPVGDSFSLVEHLPAEFPFIRRYVGMNGKKKTKEDLVRFINSLQKAIVEHKIRKTSAYADEIRFIQKDALDHYNAASRNVTIQLADNRLEKLQGIISTEKVYPSIQLIKRYIGLNGKFGVKEKAQVLLTALENAMSKGKVKAKDKYMQILKTMYKNLQTYVGSKAAKLLHIEKAELNGLNGLLGDCGCHTVHGLDGLDNEAVEAEKTHIMNSIEFCNKHFEGLGFKGKFLKLIGDPSKGFKAVVFGKPKFGKSILCTDFAGYLARNHGKVLYIAREEGLEKTMHDKLDHPDVMHANLDVADDMPDNLQGYDFVFIDSVNRMRLSPKDLENIEKQHPNTSFIYVLQSTKTGSARGSNEYLHNVDVLIEVPRKGYATQNGRFNQGGELQIFQDDDYQQAA